MLSVYSGIKFLLQASSKRKRSCLLKHGVATDSLEMAWVFVAEAVPMYARSAMRVIVGAAAPRQENVSTGALT